MTPMTPIKFLRPTFPPAHQVAADYAAIVERGMFSNGGPVEREFTSRIEGWVGNGVHASAVSSCTAGLELAIRALFDANRPLAICPSFTFAAGPLALRGAGYTPVFVDVDDTTWQPQACDAASFLAEHHHEVAGILLASTFGVADPNVAVWEHLAAHYGLPLIIDSAAGFGATHDSGEPLGARGSCEVFSLHATKTLAIGEGGVITSCDADLIDRLDHMKNFGFNDRHQAVSSGTNAKLAELSAAIGVRQLDALPHRVALRRMHLARYMAALEPLGVAFQPGAQLSAPAFVSVLLPSVETRAMARAALQNDEIECREYYNPPVHRQPFFAGSPVCRDLDGTDRLAGRMLSLPMADDLEADAALRVADVLAAVLDRQLAPALAG